MKRHWILLILFVLSLVPPAGMWYWCATRKPLDERDFTTMTGTLRSVEEKKSGKDSYLEFRLQESPMLFRVPVDGYRELFDSKAFLANVRRGSKVTIQVEKARLPRATQPQGAFGDIAFVHSIKDDRMVYSSLEGRKKWVEDNRFSGLVFAIVLTAIALALGGAYFYVLQADLRSR